MKKFTKQELSWILYDVANSAFILIVVTTVMPIFFKDVASKGIDPAVSTANWGFINSGASMILAVLAPILGTIADYRHYKKRFFMAFLGLGIIFTVLLTTVNPGEWLQCLTLFLFARIGFAGANLFYDSFLVDVAEKERMNWVSASGYGWGYIGSVIPFLIVMGIVLFQLSWEKTVGIPVESARLAFIIVALWWFIFSIPILKDVKQHHFIPASANPVRDSFHRLFNTFRDIRKYKNVFLFLLAYFFYIDGVDTIITMATSYGRDIGLSVTTLIVVILMIQIVAFPFALIYGRLADRFSEKGMIYAGIVVYTIITLISFFIPDLPTLQMKEILFWCLAFLVASSQGGIQAISRSLFGKLIPAERSAEFFGFYNIFGKFATIMGPLLMGVVSRLTGHSRFGILSILILFLIGGIVLAKVEIDQPIERGHPVIGQ